MTNKCQNCKHIKDDHFDEDFFGGRCRWTNCNCKGYKQVRPMLLSKKVTDELDKPDELHKIYKGRLVAK